MPIEAPRIDDARSAARALVASRAVSFKCALDLEDSLDRLSRHVLAGNLRPSVAWPWFMQDPSSVETALLGMVDRDGATLWIASPRQTRFGRTRFRGRWVDDANGPRLEGVISPPTLWSWALGYFPITIWVAIFMGLILPKLIGFGGWAWAALAFATTIVMPLLVMGLGSHRVAEEVNLIRAIGSVVGNPAEYAPAWRRWRED